MLNGVAWPNAGFQMKSTLSRLPSPQSHNSIIRLDVLT